MLKLTMLLRHIGPYHHARLESLNELCSLSVLVYGDMAGVAYGEFQGERSYKCVFLDGESDKRLSSIRIALDESRPDVIVLPGWSEKASLLSLRWALGKNIPSIVLSDSQEQDDSRGAVKEWVKSRIVRLFSSALVAGRKHVHYISKLGMPLERVFTGVDVVDNAYFQSGAANAKQNRHQLSSDLGLPKKFFLASNRFLPRKNVVRIVEAYAEYRGSGAPGDWGLVLLGDGEQKDAIAAACVKLNIHDNVILCGRKSYEELPIYYGLAGAFVHASISEQWGLVVNEAMASGLPVLVSNRCGCAPDLVKHGINGYTFDPYNVKELANHMFKMASGQYDREAMGQASQEIISRWTPEVFAENLYNAAKVAAESPVTSVTLLDRAILRALTIR